MRIHPLKREQFVPRPLSEVFAYFNQPENLAALTPPSLGFKILTPLPIRMEKGLRIDYAIKILGIVPQRWTSLITDYDPPRFFIDEQARGPYAYWNHRHLFQEQNGGTLVTDEVQYALPGGWMGNIAGGFFVRRQLEEIFIFRERAIEKIFPAG